MGATTVLLLSEATMLALVALVAIVVVALLVLAALILRPQPVAPVVAPQAPMAVPVAAPVVQPLPTTTIARTMPGGRSVEIDVPTRDVDEFMTALRASGWRVHETGEVVATDDDEEGLTTILVDVPQSAGRGSAEQPR